MKPFDTHAHLQFEKFETDREEIIKRNSVNLTAVVNPGADLNSSENGLLLANQVPNFYSAIGVHPHHVENWNDTYLPKLEKLVQGKKAVAVGEVGLDNYQYKNYPQPNITKQLSILLPQIELARKYQKPILFHCRDAYDELYEAIKVYQPLLGLLHCFMGSEETARKFIDLGLLISFAGNLTYKGNDHMRTAAKNLPERKILLETDSPYLTPEPLRGQRNEPLNIVFVAREIAKLRSTDEESVIQFTTENALKLFNL
jgi:TatD DNase family protein